MVETYHIKGVQKQPFADVYKIGVLKNFAKFTGNLEMLESLFNKVVHVLSYDFVEFSRTHIF